MTTDSSTDDDIGGNLKLKSNSELVRHVANELVDLAAEAQRVEKPSSSSQRAERLSSPSSTKRQRANSTSCNNTKRHKV